MHKRLPTIDDRLALERLNGGDHCPRRGLVCYASNRSGGVVLRDLRSGQETLLPARAAGAARFTPDGAALLYLAAADSGGRQLFRYELESGVSRQLSHFAGPIIDPICSPDGRRVLFASLHSAGTTVRPRRPDEAVVIEDFGYKLDGRGFIRPDEHMQLYVLDVADGTVRALTEGTEDWLQHNWLPDSRHVAAISACRRDKAETLGFDLFLLDADAPGQEPRQLSRELDMVSYPNPVRPVCAPDGKTIYMGVMDPGMDVRKGYPEVWLYAFPTEGGEARRIFQPDEGCYQCVQFPYNAGCGSGMDKVQLSEDGETLYFLSGWQGQCNLYCLPVHGDGHARLLAGGKQVYHGLSAVRGGQLLVARSLPHEPESYWLMDARSGQLLCRAAQSNRGVLEEAELSPAEDFFFPTLDGEAMLHGWAMPPQNREPGKKYPTILYIHGGPHPFYTYGFTMEHQCLAAQGFGVIFCNPRGSSGYGRRHQQLARATDGSAYMDCLQLAEEATRRFDWIDGERMGVTGGSYGGYMTNYIASHATRFRAYVSQRSVVNDLIGYASSDMQGCSRAYDSFEEFMVDQLKRSPIAWAERICRPFLILHGLEDQRTPVYGAHQLYTALKDLHPELPVKLMLFPHVGHDQPEEPRQLRRYFEEMVRWFRTYL